MDELATFRVPPEIWEARTNAINYQFQKIGDILAGRSTEALLDRYIMLAQAWLDYLNMLQAGLLQSEPPF